MIDKKSRLGVNTKSSAKFVSNLFSKSPQRLLSPKETVQYSKRLKPSINMYAEYLNKPKKVLLNKEVKVNTEGDHGLVKLVTQSYEWFKKRPFMQMLQGYKIEKQQILERHRREVENLQEKIKILQEANAELETKAKAIAEKEENLRVTPEKVLEKLQKFSVGGQRTDLTDAICAEFCNFRVAKSWAGVQRLNVQIEEFFSIDELRDNYKDIISTFCKRIVVEINKTQAAKNKASKVSSQKVDVVKIFETLKAFETDVSMSSVYN